MNKALDYFNDMVIENDLDYGYENSKCDLIRKQLIAINCIDNRALIDIKKKQLIFVNKLIFIGEELIIIGPIDNYKVEDYGITWREVREND